MHFDIESFISFFRVIDDKFYLWSSSDECRKAIALWAAFRKKLTRSNAISSYEYTHLEQVITFCATKLDLAQREAFISAYIPAAFQQQFRGLLMGRNALRNKTTGDLSSMYYGASIAFLKDYAASIRKPPKTVILKESLQDRTA